MTTPAPIQSTAKRFQQDISFGDEEGGAVWMEHSVAEVFLLFRFGGIKTPCNREINVIRIYKRCHTFKTKIRMKSISYKIAILITILIVLYSCKPSNSEIELKDNFVKIHGNIENYKGVYKTGKLTYFDALTRDIQDEIFTIDSLGNFDFSFQLVHPIINSIYFDIEGKYFSDFLIEPNTSYQITFKESGLQFNGKSGKKNQEISDFKDSLNLVFGDRMKIADRLHERGISIEEYVKHQKQIEDDKLSFLKSYSETYRISEKVKSVLASEIKFKTAHALINYRFDYTEGNRKPRKELPTDFYENLFTDYGIENKIDFQSRKCIDFISNIVSVLSIEKTSDNTLISYLESLNLYSPQEIQMLTKAYSGDKNIIETNEFNSFYKANEQKLMEIDLRYKVQLLFENSKTLNKSLTRDLVLSQGISKYYISNNLVPTSDEWFKLSELIKNQWILNFLKEYSSEKTSVAKEKTDLNQKEINSTIKEVKAKYIDKYKGKVVYIDFYATWCGPCRQEVPYAKQLHEEFKNEEVVFLNLCAKSKQEDWNNFLKQYGIEGENYLLNNEEFYLLSEIYEVQGFPTYILIDKEGNVIDYNAMRPSTKKSLYDIITELL